MTTRISTVDFYKPSFAIVTGTGQTQDIHCVNLYNRQTTFRFCSRSAIPKPILNPETTLSNASLWFVSIKNRETKRDTQMNLLDTSRKKSIEKSGLKDHLPAFLGLHKGHNYCRGWCMYLKQQTLWKWAGPQKERNHLPTIPFQVQTVSFRECNLYTSFIGVCFNKNSLQLRVLGGFGIHCPCSKVWIWTPEEQMPFKI